MASLKISCPHCDQTVKVAESAEGKKIRCPHCDKPFVAQAPDDEAPPQKRAPKKALAKSKNADDDRPRRKPARDDDDADDDDRPRKKKSKPGMSPVLMGLLGVLGLVAVVAGVVFGYPALTRGPDLAKGPGQPMFPPPGMPPPGMPPGMQPPPFNGGGNGGDENPPLPKNPEVIPARFNIQLPPAHLRPLLVTDPGGHTSGVQKAIITPDKTQVVTVSKDEGDMKLNYAHADAIAIEKALRKQSKGVFSKVETRLLTDAQATRRGIVEGLGWLKKSMTPRDVAIIFLAGHGSRGEFHFIPVDIDVRNLAGPCVSGDLIKRAVGNLPGRVVVMLDACHSGAASTPGHSAVADDLVRDLVGEDYGVVVMCSSQGREYSMESAQVKHGFFTLSILEGLSGKADFNQDRYVYIHEVSNYANLRVRQMSQGQQNPVTGRPPNIRPFPLGKLE